MKQVKIDNVLYVLSIVPYQITQDTSVETIYINCNYLDEFKELNPDLELVPYNYRLLRKSQPPYMPYVDVPDFVDFEFDSSIQNVSSMVDETKTMTLQELHLPDDYTGTVTYKLDGVLLDSSIFTLYDASLYEVLAEIPGTSLYEQDTASYQIIYSKDKYNAEISFAQSTVNVSSYVDSSYTGNIQQVSNAPENVNIKYYLNNSLLDSSVINLTEAGQYQVKAAIVSDELYNDTSTTYDISYSKYKRDVVLSFADSSVNITVEDVTEYSGNVQTVSGLPTGVTANYYLDNTLLSNGQIEISDLQEGENTFTITAKIENDSVYNDAQTSYTLKVTMEISSYENKYFTIEPLEDGTIKFSKNDLQYSTDRGTTWNTLTKDTSLGVTTGNNVIFKCTNPSISTAALNFGQFTTTGQYNISGNFMSLLYGDNFKNQLTLLPNTMTFQLFNNKVVNANNFKLPATTLADNCYSGMFQDCTSLVTAPELPATTLAKNCYSGMFQGCTSLVTAPELPATTLAYQCYRNMFMNNNKKLSYIKMLALTNGDTYNYTFNNWCGHDYNRQDVSTKGLFVKAKAMNLDSIFGNYYRNDAFGKSGIPFGWKVINNETNKEVYPLLFNTATVNVSTYTNETYTGTIQNVSCNRTIPNGLVKYYLDSSLLADNNITLTTPGVHTVLAEIVADSSIDDSSASYTINYTQVAPPMLDVSIYISFNPATETGYNQEDIPIHYPEITITTTPVAAAQNVSIAYCNSGDMDWDPVTFEPIYQWSTPYDSSAVITDIEPGYEGPFDLYVKAFIPNNDPSYNATETIEMWECFLNPGELWEEINEGFDIDGFNYPIQKIRVDPYQSGISGTHNVAFSANSGDDIIALLYENYGWYLWTIVQSGTFVDSKVQKFEDESGYITIEFQDTYYITGFDGNVQGQGSTSIASFNFEFIADYNSIGDGEP